MVTSAQALIVKASHADATPKPSVSVAPVLSPFTETAPGIWEADARTELDDLAEALDEKLAEVDEDVDTIGGLAFVIAGQVPGIGDILVHEESDWKIEILEGDDRRVTRVRLYRPEVIGAAAG